MKTWIAVGLVAMAALVAACGPFQVFTALVYGWAVFLYCILPRVTFDRPTAVLAGVCAVLLVAGVHGFGVAWSRRVGGRWRARWSLVSVALVVVAFAAGTCVVGIVHQTAWLLADDAPLCGTAEQIYWGRPPERNLKYIGMAAHSSTGAYKERFPPGYTTGPDGELLHSWETCILPFMSYGPEIDMARPWNDERNAKTFRCVIPEFINPDLRTPSLTDLEGFGLSHYAANVRVLQADKSMALSEITDGTANTILFGEVNANFKPWGYPLNLRDPAKGINRSPDGFGGARSSGGANFCMADGSVRFVNERVNQGVLRALATPAGRNAVAPGGPTGAP